MDTWSLSVDSEEIAGEVGANVEKINSLFSTYKSELKNEIVY